MFLADKLRGATIYRGWWVVGALFLSTSVYIGSSQYAFSLFIEPLEESFGWSRTQITASLSFSAVGAVTAPILGRIMDRYGARPVVLASLILLALSFLLRPLMSELWHWYELSILQFIGMSAATTLPLGRLVGIWFRRTRGRVIGLTSMGNNFGGLLIPPIVAAVLTTASWQAGYMVLAAVALLVLIFALFAIREYPPEGETVADEALKEIAKNQTAPAVTLTGWTVSEALRSKTFYAITAVVLMGTFTYITILPQIIAHLRNEGISVRDASVALGLVAIFGMAGKLGFGYLAEGITARYALMICLAGQAIFTLLMLRASSPPIIWVAVPLFGLCMGAFGPLFQLMVQESFGIRNFGSIMGLISFCTIVPYIAGPLLAGLSFDLTGSYGAAFIAVSVLFLVAALLLTQARPTQPQT